MILDQVTILRMPQNLSCRDECKFITRRHRQNYNQNKDNFKRFQLWAHKPQYEMDPWIHKHWFVKETENIRATILFFTETKRSSELSSL